MIYDFQRGANDLLLCLNFRIFSVLFCSELKELSLRHVSQTQIIVHNDQIKRCRKTKPNYVY